VLCVLPLSPAVAQHLAKSADAGGPSVGMMEGLGTHTHTITTARSEAQAYFDQGLRLLYAFNHDEAIRAFRAAARVDPQCAMAHWGIALAWGPNYNLEAEKERNEAAYQALLVAQKLMTRASPREQAYIAALGKRYSSLPHADRKVLDAAYADAMRQLVKSYPDDLDAAVLFAESMMDLRPWDLWAADGSPQPGTDEIVATLEGVLRRNPNHPGANHFYIHAVEASNTPERGLAAALRLSGMGQGTGLAISEPLMPASGHLVHMPSHIYFRIGWYSAAVEANRRAIAVDRKYIEQYQPAGIYPMMYYPHNIHFAWAALSMEGRGAEAIDAASQIADALRDEMVLEMPMLEYFVPTRMYTLARFEKWEAIAGTRRPRAEFTFATGMWHYVQGLRLVALADSAQAKAHQRELETIVASTPADKRLMRHSALRLLQIAQGHLGAVIDRREGNIESALKQLRAAIELQDGLAYDEPPPWYFSVRQLLGNVLLEAQRPAEAEAAFREDLARHPENGWSLHGLEKSLRSQNRPLEADQVHDHFERAWARADFPLSGQPPASGGGS
jgi:tetratricopeptide (TPR) repeat protein